jgi:hypothetical protein
MTDPPPGASPHEQGQGNPAAVARLCPAGASVTLCVFPRLFSSSLCDRLMLRQPSIYHPTLREEGCSSTAFNRPPREGDKCWNNSTDRS